MRAQKTGGADFVPTPPFPRADEKGFAGIPVTEGGTQHGKLLGMVLKDSSELEADRTLAVKDVMVGFDELVKAKHPCTLEEAYEILKSARIKVERRPTLLNGMRAMILRTLMLRCVFARTVSSDHRRQRQSVGADHQKRLVEE
eukprot:scaffold1376_cov257-Pinguiococcus_pyrenoidosus.AAC.17